MSRSSARRGTSAPSATRRGQTEPLAALAAVLVVGLALGLYADVLGAVEPGQSGSPTADAALQRVHDAVTDDGVAVPGRLSRARGVAPAGYDLNATLVAGDERWTGGPAPPSSAGTASRVTPVRITQWTVRSGRLKVVVWS